MTVVKQFGKTSTEFIEQVGEGIDKALALEIEVSDELSEKGISTGKYSIDASSPGVNNVFVLYLIFNKDFKQTIKLKAFDKNGLEIGRTSMEVTGNKDEAGYFDFVFDTRTKLDKRGKIIIE